MLVIVVIKVIIYNYIRHILYTMPPKSTSSVPARLQTVWQASSTLNRGYDAPIQASPSAFASSSYLPIDGDSSAEEDEDDENGSSQSELELPPLRAITKSQETTRKQRKGKEEDILQGKVSRRPSIAPDEYIILLKICMHMSDTYRSAEGATFFKNVTADWQKETGKEHNTLRRVLRRNIAARRKYLQNLGTGEQDGRTERELYEDSWIAVLDAEAAVIQERKEHRGAIGAKTEASFLALAAMLLTMKEKRVINPPLPSPRNPLPAFQAQQLASSEEAKEAIFIDDEDGLSQTPL
jgi:hypothetical protein